MNIKINKIDNKPNIKAEDTEQGEWYIDSKGSYVTPLFPPNLDSHDRPFIYVDLDKKKFKTTNFYRGQLLKKIEIEIIFNVKE